MLFNILCRACSFLRMSTVGLAAQSHGRGDTRECVDVLWRGLLLGVVLGAGGFFPRGQRGMIV